MFLQAGAVLAVPGLRHEHICLEYKRETAIQAGLEALNYLRHSSDYRRKRWIGALFFPARSFAKERSGIFAHSILDFF